ncbi:signal peptidase I [Desulfoscipio gibsoniae]|uniref:Signal peptidase I n=1 Tax=Desulfoscipio gibsoniae DSM 7213 TaxID=767817 RepID=R4KKV0_9FIRM|nr:signal peptidase I [Desulfoscipio gibsoniae]AGL00266.1 signal peptidase I [Desulfoscipio gibsoniae DSM 7213]
MKMLTKIWGWMSTCGMAFVITLFISVFIFQPYKVEGHSMDPTLHDQERIYVSKLQRTFSCIPEYGDIVIIDSRINRNRSLKDDIMEFPAFEFILGKKDNIYYVKRVIGTPGDVIEFKDDRFYRNGVELSEPYIKETMNHSSEMKWVVPENHVFVMGDNRNYSYDSRAIGFIPLEHIMGKMIF